MKKILFSQDQQKQICDLYKNGISSYVIANKFKVHQKVILNILRVCNISLRKSGTQKGNIPWNKVEISKEESDKICNLYLSGLSQEEIIKDLDIPLSLVKRVLKDNNVKIRPLSEIMKGKHNSPNTQFKSGHETWNKDLTKDKDERVKEYGEKVSLMWKDEEFRNNHCGKNHHNFGKQTPHGHKTYLHKTPLQGLIKMFHWEYLLAKYYDSCNIIYYYEPQAFELILNNGKFTTYTPDFYLPSTNEYIEVKGYWRGDAKEKFDAFKIQYPNINIKLLMIQDLKELGIKL